MEEALLALIALVDGEFDNQHLMRFGALPEDFRETVKYIALAGIQGEASILDAKDRN